MSRVVLDLSDLEGAVRVFDGASRDLDSVALRLRVRVRSTGLDRRHSLIRRAVPTDESGRVSSLIQGIADQIEVDARELGRIADYVEEELRTPWRGPSFLSAPEAMGGSLLERAGGFFDYLKNAAGTVFSAVKEFGADVLAGIRRFAETTIDTLFKGAQNVFGVVRDVVGDLAQGFRDLPATVGAFLTSLLGRVAQGMESLFDGAAAVLGRVIDVGVGLVASVIAGAGSVVGGLAARVLELLDAWRALPDRMHRLLLELLGLVPPSVTAPRTESEYLAELAAAPDPMAWWNGLTDAERNYLAVDLHIGNREGIPYEIRYRANNLAIDADRKKLELTIETEIAGLMVMGRYGDASARLRYLGFLREYSTACSSDGGGCKHQVLYYDPAAGFDHGVVEVHGDLDHAVDVTVAIPGQSTNLGNFEEFSDTVGGLSEGDPTRATIAFLDYDAPDNLLDEPISSDEKASIDDSSLSSIIGGLPGGQSVTLLGHSAGTAASQYFVVSQQGSDAVDRIDRIILLAPPGISKDFQEVASGIPVFIGRYQNDVIGLTSLAQGLTGIEDGQDPGALTNIPPGWTLNLSLMAPEGFGPISFAAHGVAGYLSGDMLDDINLFRQGGMDRTVTQTTNPDGTVDIVITYTPRF